MLLAFARMTGNKLTVEHSYHTIPATEGFLQIPNGLTFQTQVGDCSRAS